MLLASLVVPVAGADQDSTDVAVLFDFGNGVVMWADVQVAPGGNMYNATQAAAENLSLALDASEGMFGMMVNSIAGLEYNATTQEFWGFWTWNSTSNAWEMAAVGSDSVLADNATAIAWLYAPWGSSAPLATPEYRYPWASFRHDALNSGSQLIHAPTALAPLWEVDVGNGAIDAPIVAANGYLYVVTGGRLNSTTWAYDTNSSVYCLDEDGATVWHSDIGQGYQMASPLIDGNKLIVPSGDGKVYAFYLNNGTTAWVYDTGSAASSGVTSSPIGYLNQVIVADGNGYVTSLRLSDGSVAWKRTVAPVVVSTYYQAAFYSSSPAIKSGVVYIGAENGTLHALSAADGSEMWNVSVGHEIKGSPVFYDDMVVVTYLNHTGTSVTSGGFAMVSDDGELLGQIATGVTPASATLTSAGFAAVTSQGLVLVDFDGDLLWNVSLGTAGPGAAATAVNGTIFMVTNEANARLLAVNMDGEITTEIALGSEYALSAPAMAMGNLYISGDNGHVYAYALRSSEITGVSIGSSQTGLNATFTAGTPTDGSIYSYRWDFGDGNTSTGQQANHIYAKAGTYTVVLTVSDLLGNEKNTSRAVSVTEQTTTKGGDDGTLYLVAGIAILAILAVAVAVFLMRRKR